MRAVPLSARVSPARIEISVVLPAPFGPEQAEEFALRPTVRLTPSSACTRPKRRATLTTSTAMDKGENRGKANSMRESLPRARRSQAAEHVLDAVQVGERGERQRARG